MRTSPEFSNRFQTIAVTEFLNNVLFIFQRLNWLGIIDILLVALIFFGVLYLVRDTQAMILLRGIIFILVLVALVVLASMRGWVELLVGRRQPNLHEEPYVPLKPVAEASK